MPSTRAHRSIHGPTRPTASSPSSVSAGSSIGRDGTRWTVAVPHVAVWTARSSTCKAGGLRFWLTRFQRTERSREGAFAGSPVLIWRDGKAARSASRRSRPRRGRSGRLARTRRCEPHVPAGASRQRMHRPARLGEAGKPRLLRDWEAAQGLPEPGEAIAWRDETPFDVRKRTVISPTSLTFREYAERLLESARRHEPNLANWRRTNRRPSEPTRSAQSASTRRSAGNASRRSSCTTLEAPGLTAEWAVDGMEPPGLHDARHHCLTHWGPRVGHRAAAPSGRALRHPPEPALPAGAARPRRGRRRPARRVPRNGVGGSRAGSRTCHIAREIKRASERRGGDSNPRTRLPPVTRFPVAPVQPLRHLSVTRVGLG